MTRRNQFLEIYSKFLQQFLKPQKPLKVIFDCSNGTAGLVLKKLLKPKTPALPAGRQNLKPIFINEKPDGNFPAINQLRAAVKKNKADLGVIFDGDADRALFVDNKSHFIDSDAIARLLIWHLRPKKIVIDVRVGWLLRNLKIIESQVGHPFIEKKIVSEQADLGFEHSGHYYFKKFFYLDSGILAALEVINAVSRLPYKFSDFVDLLPRYYRQEINFPLNQLKYKTPASLSKRFGGLRKEFSDYWFNFHFSQTEPLLRLDIEAVDKPQLQKQILKFKKILL
jgi:phosphomannomutase